MALPTELVDDVTAEILLRLPPDEPEHLFRASLVCKPWLRLLSDPAFLRRYRAFHGAPPLLGVLHRLQVLDGDPKPCFTPTTAVPAFPHPGSDGRDTRALDCRHGRALIHMWEDEIASLLVWDPVTGNRHILPEPNIDWMAYSATVFCAVAGCDHLDCHGGLFGVAFVGTDGDLDGIWASVYSSQTGAWSEPTHLKNGAYYYVQPRRGILIGDEIYFTLSQSRAIVKYDWRKNCLSPCNPPPPETYKGWVTLMVMEDSSLGFAGIEDSRLYLWRRKVNAEGAAEWVQHRVIELESLVPMAGNGDIAYVVGFAEGVGIIFVKTSAGLFTIKLKTGHVRKVDEPGVYFSVLPYMSFYTPECSRFSLQARTQRKAIAEGAAEWVQCRVIELETMVPMAGNGNWAHVVGFAEDVSIIFVKTSAGLFMIKLKSGHVRKVGEPGDYFNALPYMSFYIPVNKITSKAGIL
ncbi:hypothetical protein EJB05_14411 [Eragrostis curvula]|uniref:Uncharacterized protein n=1 Tax=Eragrostis curvula TaxID=38414 RepID=A0A5J9VZ90_9POAL|nr:hypothetical protein EJB05_14411 [Eragrostis curvula]